MALVSDYIFIKLVDVINNPRPNFICGLTHFHYSDDIMSAMNERDGVSNHLRLDCLLRYLLRQSRSKNIPKPMMTSSNGNIFRVTDHLCGEFTGPQGIPLQRPVARSFYVFFDLRRIKSLKKQSSDWWFETLSRPLWRHRNAPGHWPFVSAPPPPLTKGRERGKCFYLITSCG